MNKQLIAAGVLFSNVNILGCITRFLPWIDEFSFSKTSKKIIFKRTRLEDIIRKDFDKRKINFDGLFGLGLKLTGSMLHHYLYGNISDVKNINFYNDYDILERLNKKDSIINMNDDFVTITTSKPKRNELPISVYEMKGSTRDFIDDHVDISICCLFFDGKKLHYRNMHHMMSRTFIADINFICGIPVKYHSMDVSKFVVPPTYINQKLLFIRKWKNRKFRCLNSNDVTLTLEKPLEQLQDLVGTRQGNSKTCQIL